MSDMENKFGDNVSWFCYEGAISLDDTREPDGSLADEFEVIGEDENGAEGSCTVGVIDLLGSAHAEMENMKKQLASQISASTKANHLRIKELEEALQCIVIMYGQDDSYDGGLLPIDEQEGTVQNAMKLLPEYK